MCCCLFLCNNGCFLGNFSPSVERLENSLCSMRMGEKVTLSNAFLMLNGVWWSFFPFEFIVRTAYVTFGPSERMFRWKISFPTQMVPSAALKRNDEISGGKCYLGKFNYSQIFMLDARRETTHGKWFEWTNEWCFVFQMIEIPLINWWIDWRIWRYRMASAHSRSMQFEITFELVDARVCVSSVERRKHIGNLCPLAAKSVLKLSARSDPIENFNTNPDALNSTNGTHSHTPMYLINLVVFGAEPNNPFDACINSSWFSTEFISNNRITTEFHSN